jgi:hypothetical protein
VSTRITDGSAGQQLHITCDRCGTEVVIALGVDGTPAGAPPSALIGWRRGIGQHDVCPDCQSKTDLPTLRPRS